MQKFPPDAAIEPNSFGDILNIRPYLFTEIGDFVNEADLGGQKCVRSVFDQLGCFNCGNDKRGFDKVKRTIDRLEHVSGAFRAHAQHYPIRSHEVVYGGALAQELWVARNIEGGVWIEL